LTLIHLSDPSKREWQRWLNFIDLHQRSLSRGATQCKCALHFCIVVCLALFI